MIIDLQMTADNLVRGIQNELRNTPICFTKELNTGTDTFLLDHFEITNNTVLDSIAQTIQVTGKGVTHTIAGSAVRVTQEVVLHFVTITALQASGAAPTPLPGTSITIHFALTLVISGGRPYLHLEYLAPADAESIAALIPDAGAQIDAALSGFTGSVPLHLSGVDMLAGFTVPMLFTNAGMVLGGGGVLTLRLENGTDADLVSAWTGFYAGAVPDRLNGQQWALFVDKRLLVPILLGIANQPAGTKFSPSGPPEGDWAGDGHGIYVTRKGVMPDAGPFNSDVDVTVELELDFSVASPDVFVLDLSISAAGEVSGLLGTIMDVFGISADPSAPLPSADGWTKTGATSYQRKEYPYIWDPQMGHFVVEQILPDAAGLHLVGSVHAAQAVVPAGIDATLQPFQWGTHGSCGDGWNISALGYLGLTNTGTAPLTVCEASVVYDPDKQFPVTIKMADSASSQFTATIAVEVRYFQPAYLKRSDPYACLLLVKTNGGARVVSLGVPAQLGQAEEDRLQIVYDELVVSCMKLVDQFWIYRLNPQWIPDPGPDERALHLWQILVRGLNENEQVTILDGEGRVEAVGQAGATGVAYVRSVGPAQSDGGSLTVFRSDPAVQGLQHHGGAQQKTRSVDVRQVLLQPVGELPVRDQSATLLAGRYRSGPVLVVAGRSRAQIYDMRHPARPALVQEVAVADLVSAGVELAPGDFPSEFGARHHGPVSMQSPGVLVGDVFARLDNFTIRVFAPTQVARWTGSRSAPARRLPSKVNAQEA